MNSAGEHIIHKFQKRWQVLMVIQVILYGLCAALMVYMLSSHLVLSFCIFVVVCTIGLLFKKPWQLSSQKIIQFLDESLIRMENSTGLLILPEKELSNLAVLQRYKVTERLQLDIAKVHPNVEIKRAVLILLGCIITVVLAAYFDLFTQEKSSNLHEISKEQMVLLPVDSARIKNIAPKITSQKLTVKYPAYTKKSSRTTSNMNIKALEGSKIYWNIQFDAEIDSVFIEQESLVSAMKLQDKAFLKSTTLRGSGFYNFKFVDTMGDTYLSDLYAIEVLKDAVPKIEIQDLKQFTSFEIGGDQKLSFKTLITDDYGISEAYIIATVTKGEGESVKFREERLAFNTIFKSGDKNLNLTQTIDLQNLKMEAGDELYFYVEAIDVKNPKANRSRSETYFAAIRDTTSNSFAVEGTMGADLMPDYFRSQRQLIIDTEKLIADKNKISKIEFNSRSNELGYDQKALRLKYGQFMGDEADSGIQTQQDIEIEEAPMQEESNEEDPLQKYTHDHDGSNEHNLVDHDHEKELNETEEESPLEEYVHNHDDPEESTLFSQSLKGKLRQAMSEMWDAELHLRLYKPENSLEYQYRALKLIQEIKNSARIYVHRIGFDPPPIKEEKRLTGVLTDVKTYQKNEEAFLKDNAENLRKSITRIDELLTKPTKLTAADRQLFNSAGNELAVMAIEKPGRYLSTLQGLKWLAERTESSDKELLEIQLSLLNVVPQLSSNPSKSSQSDVELNALMLKELNSND